MKPQYYRTGEKTIDNALQLACETVALVDEANHGVSNHIFFFGSVNFSFFHFYNKLYCAHRPRFDYIWLRLKKNFEEFFTYGPVLKVPGAISRHQYGNLTTPFKITPRQFSKIRENPYYQWAYDNIMQNFPHSEATHIEQVILWTEQYFHAMFDIIRPKAFLLWNPFVASNKVAESVARERSIPVIYAESGPLPGTICFSTWGDLGESRPAREPGYFLSLPISNTEISGAQHVIDYLKESGINRNKQKKKEIQGELAIKLRRERPTIFYAGQNDLGCGLAPYDATAKKYYSPEFPSSESALRYLAVLARNNDWNLIYKPHPLEPQINRGNSDIVSNVIYIAEGDINELVDISDVVITILSTTAYVALVRDKPVVMLGKIQLRGQHCTYEAFEKDKIEGQIQTALEQGYTESQKQAFVEHVTRMNKYCLFDSMEPRELRYGRPVEEAIQFIETAINGKGDF